MTGSSLPRLLLVGAGAMGSHHGRVIAESQRCELAAVVDPAECRGSSLARRFGVDWMPEVDSLSNVDAVVVASSTDQHREIALNALEANIPLFVEKPLCASLGESREVVETALRRGVPLMCGFVERFNPAVVEALSRADAPSAVYAQRLSAYSPRMNAGVTWDVLVHDLDITLRIFDGETPKIVSAAIGRSGDEGRIGEDSVAAVLEFPGARTAGLSASRMSPRRVRQLAICEKDRNIVADLLNPSVAVYGRSYHGAFPSADDLGDGREISERIECSDYPEPLAAQCDRFVDLIEGKCDAHAETRSILPSHEAVAAILDCAEESADTSFRNSEPLSL
ncbi:Gfo/Idh/MocA family protein [Streptomyces iranensis]|uniref:Gfo/Idh/MocA family protein n=1 Tax=Streptomyces iranensis TaxID=576784 RepID=UPI00099BB67B|nr:Gfo/Idh/MocA family oxidoreductase [Streptomyces iranensis]